MHSVDENQLNPLVENQNDLMLLAIALTIDDKTHKSSHQCWVVVVLTRK